MIRYPNIIGKTDAQKLEQMRSYLHQLADELNFQLDRTGNLASGYVSTANDTAVAANPTKKNDAVSNFNDIKALIIKSADIVDAYYEEISKRLDGHFVAESEFGTFKEETALQFEANSKRIELVFTNQQEINSDLEQVKQQNIDIRAYIRYGLLYEDEESGESIYGLEIGQTTDKNGETVYSKFVRMASNKLSFYDENGIEVAYASGERFCCPAFETDKLFLGGFQLFPRTNGNLSMRWIGGA